MEASVLLPANQRARARRAEFGCALPAAIVAAILAPAAAPAAEPPAGTLEEVIVKGQLLRAEAAPYSVTVLAAEDVRLLAVGDTDEIFERVPGMAVRDFQLGGVASAIVIRGFGNGGHGGDLGVVLDGVPLNEAMSHADGYVDLNVVVPLEIGGFTVFRGPVSPLYGNFNRGGLLVVETRKSGEYAAVDLAGGSHGTADLQAAYGGALGALGRVDLAGRYFRSDGHRPQSGEWRGTLAGRWSLDATPRLRLALSARRHRGDADSASYLLRPQFLVDPQGIDPRVQGDGADKDFGTLRGDLGWTLGTDTRLVAYGYSTTQDFTRWFTRPVGATWRQREEAYERQVRGVGASLNGRLAIAGASWSYVAGVEGFRESTAFTFHEALVRRQRTGPAVNDRETTLDSESAFAELQVPLHPLAQFAFGLRADRFDGGCRRRGPETGSDPCGALNDPSHVSPKLGLRSAVADDVELRASWAEGFALPNGFVKYSVGGQPLDETVFRQTELGARWRVGAALDLDVAAYRLVSDGEVRTVSAGVFENFGATRREGVELSATWRPDPRVGVTALWASTRTEITRNADATLVGRRIAGVPDETATLELRWEPTPAWSATAAWRHVGDYAIDAANLQVADSYGLLDLGLAWRSTARWPFRAYLAVDNATDRRYASNELLLGGQRAVAPGLPRTLRAGLQFDFL